MFTKQTIHDVDLQGKRVLLRADYNVPLDGDGKITDDYRIKQSIPTLLYLLEHGVSKLVICSHLGRPSGPGDTANSLKPVAERLHELLGRAVAFAPDCMGSEARAVVEKAEIVLLENLRFHPEEEKNDDAFAAQLAEASTAELFVQDGFGVVHRAHASTEAITHHLPAVAGLLLEKEVDTITNIMEAPERPLAAIIGGAKIADKIDILHRFIEMADFVAIGGAMANTFLAAQGIAIADSLIDKDEIPVARDIIAKAEEQGKQRPFTFALPRDGVVASKIDKLAPTRIIDWGEHITADIENYPKRVPRAASHIHAHEKILDIGPFSGAFIAGGLQLAHTVVWNGTMGVTEQAGVHGPVGPYAHGTEVIVDAMLGQFGNRPFSLVGGGDTVGYVEARGLVGAFNHVSTGGGASLELMAGRTLPGVAALLEKTW